MDKELIDAFITDAAPEGWRYEKRIPYWRDLERGGILFSSRKGILCFIGVDKHLVCHVRCYPELGSDEFRIRHIKVGEFNLSDPNCSEKIHSFIYDYIDYFEEYMLRHSDPPGF